MSESIIGSVIDRLRSAIAHALAKVMPGRFSVEEALALLGQDDGGAAHRAKIAHRLARQSDHEALKIAENEMSVGELRELDAMAKLRHALYRDDD